jgi:transposase
MKKYKTEFEVVQSFLAGEGGAKLLTRRWSVSIREIARRTGLPRNAMVMAL